MTNSKRGMAAMGQIPGLILGQEWRFLKSQLLDYMGARAVDEQRQRLEKLADKKNQPPPITTEPAKRGRPSKKVDLSKYQ